MSQRTSDDRSGASNRERMDGLGDFRGAPSDRVPGFANPLVIDGLQLELTAPVAFEIAYRLPQYCVLAPFSRAPMDISLHNEPMRQLVLPASAAFLSPPDTTVRTRLAEPIEFLIIGADPSRVEPVIDRVAGGKAWLPTVVETHVDPGMAALQTEIRRSLLSDPMREAAYLSSLVDAAFARFACRMVGLAVGAESREVLPPGLLRRLVRMIEANLAQRITVEGLAKEAGLSRSHFSRAFQAATGEAPQEFIISRRIYRARDLLVETDRSIAEVAAETGFASHAHLSTAFKKRLGVSPANYRRSFDADDPPALA